MKTVLAIFAVLAVAQVANAGFLDNVVNAVNSLSNLSIDDILKFKPSDLQALEGKTLVSVFKKLCPNVQLPEEATAIKNLQESVKRMNNASLAGSILKGLTCLSHMSLQQFRDTMLTAIPPQAALNRTGAEAAPMRRKRQAVPDSVDWRTKGYVTPVKNQGSCGSCWTFSATGAMEGALMKKTGKLPNLSEQNLLDCVRTDSAGNGCCNGCNGGWMADAYTWVTKNAGVNTGASYAYTGTQAATCKYTTANNAGKVTSYQYTAQNDETDLKNKVATIGPVATAIDASSIQNYKSGILTCPGTTLNHGVLIVGYGVDATNGTQYWIVKNSWGTTWGEQGYMRIARGSNQCGIATAASYPIA